MRRSYTAVMAAIAMTAVAGCAAPDPLDNLDSTSPSVAPSAVPSETAEPATQELPDAALPWAYPQNNPPMPDSGNARSEIGDEDVRRAVNWALSVDAATAYDVALWDYMLTNQVAWEDLDGVQLAPWFEFLTPAGSDKFEEQLDNLADPDKGVRDFVIVPAVSDDFEWPAPSLRPTGVIDADGKTIPADMYKVAAAEVGPESELYPGQNTVTVTFESIHRYDFLRDGEWQAISVVRPWTMTLAAQEDPQMPFLIQDWTLGDTETFATDAVPREVAPTTAPGGTNG